MYIFTEYTVWNIDILDTHIKIHTVNINMPFSAMAGKPYFVNQMPW